MSNPLFLLKSLAVQTEESNLQLSNTTFVPSVLVADELFLEIQNNKDRFEDNNLTWIAFNYLYSVAHLREDSYKYLAMLFEYKAFLVKTILETAIYLMGDSEIRLINRIFRSTSEDMSAETAVQCTKMMLSSPKWSSFTLNRLDTQKINPNWNVKAIITETGVLEKEYLKLEYCEKKYWSFPLYLRELKSKKINTQLLFVTDLPSLEALDIKRAREVSEYSTRYMTDD